MKMPLYTLYIKAHKYNLKYNVHIHTKETNKMYRQFDATECKGKHSLLK